MSFIRRVVTLAAAGVVLALPLAAQGIPRGGSIRTTPARAAARVLVATPYVFQSTDSAAAVAVGRGIRRQMERVVGRDYAIIPDTQMNRALNEFGYPSDAILSPLLARTLALQIQGRYVLTSTLNRVDSTSDRFAITARLVGANDDAGYTLHAVQEPGQDLAAFGQQVAAAFDPAIDALEDARECVTLSQEDPEKAKGEAEKALKAVPDHGLASYCLAQLAIRDSAGPQQIIPRLQSAVKGDSLSLPAWTLLAQQYQLAGDTAQMLSAFENMLRVAPNNQPLREEIFRQFLNLGQIDRAKRVADEGLKNDPYNAELWDLKSNACLFASDFACAVESLEQAYAIDSTRADTLFFTKIAVASEQRLLDTTNVATSADTAAYLRWTRTGAQRFPENPTVLSYLAKAYAVTGQADSSVAVIRKIATTDSTGALDAALGSVQSFADAGMIDSAGPVIEFVGERGSVEQKDRLAGLLMQRASQLLQPPTPQYEAAVNLARPAAQMADPNGQYYATANYLFGVAGLQRAAEIDKVAAEQKSCEMAQEENALLKEAAEALPKGREFNAQTVEQYSGYISQYLTRSEAMVKSFCG
ncbi:MAG: hypothetical protein M3Y31_10385 [Gemmatimonadota bacterium]|nr:hypothetical protein [Gemmatimonadota bacterium]